MSNRTRSAVAAAPLRPDNFFDQSARIFAILELMADATLIYPHQLVTPQNNHALSRTRRVYIIEEPLLITYNPAHRQRLLTHRLSLRAYRDELRALGFDVSYLGIGELPDTAAVWKRLRSDGIDTIHVADTTDTYLERELGKAAASHGILRRWSESPIFMLSREEAMHRYLDSGRHMARFYRRLRLDRGLLVDEHGNPDGGQWSFDADNRKKLPKNLVLPVDIDSDSLCESMRESEISEATDWLSEVSAELYGETRLWVPCTREGAEAFFQCFLKDRFERFGPYEDALTLKHKRVFHSTLSPLLNTGLLTPAYVLDSAIEYAARSEVPLQSLEGFVRQILGWREFMRAAYETDGSQMRRSNYFGHTRQLPDSFWHGTTGLPPVDHAIRVALEYGYTHHIDRLMVLGNVMLLLQTHPDSVYRWFMAMYIDAYDWVMVPNVYGMSQFADGGLFATKPYISGSNYVRKMSDYPRGEWEESWTALYWHFIETHRDVFTTHHRLSMMPRMLDRMSSEKRRRYEQRAREWL